MTGGTTYLELDLNTRRHLCYIVRVALKPQKEIHSNVSRTIMGNFSCVFSKSLQ